MATIILFWFNEGLNSISKNIINIQNLTKPYFFILYTWSITILQWKFPTYWFKFYIWVEFKKKEAFQSLVIKKKISCQISISSVMTKLHVHRYICFKKSTCGACVQWLFKLLHIVESWILLNIKEHIKKMNRKISQITMNTE